MRVLVVGASGAIGTRLVPRLVGRRHEVIGSSLSAEQGELLRRLAVEPDALDARAVREVGSAVQPHTPTASTTRSMAAVTEGGTP